MNASRTKNEPRETTMNTDPKPPDDTGGVISLSELPAGARALIRHLEGGKEILSRLATLGFTPGATLNMIQNYGRGPIIVCIRDARIALGRGEARKILVSPNPDDHSVTAPCSDQNNGTQA